jgi:hypothetical protein
MIRHISDVAATGAKTIALLAVAWAICNGFIILDWWVAQ